MQRIRPYLQLVRLPAVFTAMADIFLGFLVTQEDPAGSLLTFALLLVASSCLYLAGMVFNDIFDRKVDARERPQRPIPSGRVSLAAAVRLGILLIVGGLGAADAAGIPSLLIALMLTGCILAYDGGLKQTPAGPVVMGACRFFNVLLGASAAGDFAAIWAAPQLCLAALLGVYIAGVTWFGRTEARRSDRYQLAGAMTVINLSLAGLAGFAAVWEGGYWWGSPLSVLLILGVIALTINRRLTAALKSPDPRHVQAAVKLMLFSVITLDAAFVLFHTGRPLWAAATALLLLPATTLGRWVFVT